MGAGSPVLVEADHASRTYRRGTALVEAVREASLRVRAGDRVALTGPSGSGKSTLLLLLAAIEAPTTGRVAWPGLGPGPLRPAHLGIVLQGAGLLPPLTALENVSLPLDLAGVPRGEAIGAATAALERLGLADLADKLPEELSGGQAERVAVARMLAARPPLVLADEPTGQLDHPTGAIVVDALLEGVGDGSALIVATHDPAVAERFDVRWSMADGLLDAGGSVR